MIIIGEKINSTLKAIRPAMENYDAATIIEMAKLQTDAGASFLDINAGMFYADESERVKWLVETVQEAVDTPICVDSPSHIALEVGLKACKRKALINSLTDEKERFDTVMPLVTKYDAGIIALCMDDTGMPETADDRVRIGERLIEKITKEGVKMDDIYIDPMIRPIGTGSHYGNVALDTIRMIRNEFPDVHITSGLSNISFGIPMRKLMNMVFLVAAISAGMDSAIMNPLDKKFMSILCATQALIGEDDFCMNYLTKFRADELEL